MEPSCGLVRPDRSGVGEAIVSVSIPLPSALPARGCTDKFQVLSVSLTEAEAAALRAAEQCGGEDVVAKTSGCRAAGCDTATATSTSCCQGRRGAGSKREAGLSAELAKFKAENAELKKH